MRTTITWCLWESWRGKKKSVDYEDYWEDDEDIEEGELKARTEVEDSSDEEIEEFNNYKEIENYNRVKVQEEYIDIEYNEEEEDEEEVFEVNREEDRFVSL